MNYYYYVIYCLTCYKLRRPDVTESIKMEFKKAKETGC